MQSTQSTFSRTALTTQPLGNSPIVQSPAPSSHIILTAASEALPQQNAATTRSLPGIAVSPNLPSTTHAALAPMTLSPTEDSPEFFPFDQIREHTRDSFTTMLSVSRTIRTNLPLMTHAAAQDPVKAKALIDHKAYRDAAPSHPAFFELKSKGEAAYALIQGRRPDSLLEQYLPSSWKQKLSPLIGCFRDPVSGLVADLREVKRGGDSKAFIMTFAGTFTGGAHFAQVTTDIQQFFGTGGIPAAYAQAYELTRALQQSLPPNVPLNLVGHSLGGGIANYVGLKLDLASACYNPAALGGACLSDLKETVVDLTERKAKQAIIRIDFDPVSSPIVQEVLINMRFSAFGNTAIVPKCVGIHYIAPREILRPENQPLSKIHSMPALEDLYRSEST